MCVWNIHKEGTCYGGKSNLDMNGILFVLAHVGVYLPVQIFTWHLGKNI